MGRGDHVRLDREARERAAKELAATLPPGEYHAYDQFVIDSKTRQAVAQCATHWDACLTMMATARA